MSGTVSISGSGGRTAATTTAGDPVDIVLGDDAVRQRVDVAVDTSGAATLTVSVSDTGDYEGEEFDVQTIDYTEAITQLEQFDFAYSHVRVSVDSNLNNLEATARGA